MRRLSTVTILGLGLLIATATDARAQGRIGPVCMRAEQFPNVWKLHFLNTGENQFIGTGHDLSTNRPLSASLVLVPGTALLSLYGSIPPTGANHAFFLTANVSLQSLSGPGRCEAVNSTSGCGTGIPVTLTVVACPAGDQAADSASGKPGDR